MISKKIVTFSFTRKYVVKYSPLISILEIDREKHGQVDNKDRFKIDMLTYATRIAEISHSRLVHMLLVKTVLMKPADWLWRTDNESDVGCSHRNETARFLDVRWLHWFTSQSQAWLAHDADWCDQFKVRSNSKNADGFSGLSLLRYLSCSSNPRYPWKLVLVRFKSYRLFELLASFIRFCEFRTSRCSRHCIDNEINSKNFAS